MFDHYQPLLLVPILFAVGSAGDSPLGPTGIGQEARRLAQESKFIFKGTVQKLKASTMPGFSVTDRTITVRVDQLLQAPQEFSHVVGKDITVLLQKGAGLKVGQTAYFFTNGAVYGASMAVREVGRIDANAKTPDQIRAEIGTGNQNQKDREVQQRIAKADLIVTGKVTAIKRPDRAGNAKRPPITEHDPEWREAIIKVESVEKGKLKVDTVAVLFPTSKDVMWYKAPRFRVGQEGIWILHRGVAKRLGIEGYTALDPADVHSKDQVNRVKKLVAAGNP